VTSLRAAEVAGIIAALGVWTALLAGPIPDALSPRAATPPAAAAAARSRSSDAADSAPRARAGGDSAGVAGLVLDGHGRPVAGAVVLIRALATETPVGWLRAISDARGMFRVAGLLPGLYALVAVHDDMPTGVSEPTRLLAGATVRVLLVLDEEAEQV